MIWHNLLDDLFSTGPEEKGIETKGDDGAFVVLTCSALALKKKGLRPRSVNALSICALFSTGPEEKGIETALRWVRYLCLSLVQHWP